MGAHCVSAPSLNMRAVRESLTACCRRYDATWSVILALDAVLSAGGDIDDGDAVLAALKEVTFEGAEAQPVESSLITLK